MANNEFKIENANGSPAVSAFSSVRASCQHTCDCGQQFTLTIDWPEGLRTNGALSLTGCSCPVCQLPVNLPAAQYWVEDYQLKSSPL